MECLVLYAFSALLSLQPPLVYLMSHEFAMPAVNQQASTLTPSVRLGSLESSLLHFLPLLPPSSVLWVSGLMPWHAPHVLQPDSAPLHMPLAQRNHIANTRDICAQYDMYKFSQRTTFLGSLISVHSLSCLLSHVI